MEITSPSQTNSPLPSPRTESTVPFLPTTQKQSCCQPIRKKKADIILFNVLMVLYVMMGFALGGAIKKNWTGRGWGALGGFGIGIIVAAIIFCRKKSSDTTTSSWDDDVSFDVSSL